MSSGVFHIDRDIICPCDYRDPDVEDYGTCYCCLYVDSATHKSGETKPIPERRPMEKQIRSLEASIEIESDNEVDLLSVPVLKLYYCRQCGYVVFREEPPYVCPICRAKKDFFAEVEQTKMKI
jgi:rubrerythrin